MTQPPYGGQPYQNQRGYQVQGPATKNKLPMLLAGLIAVLGLAVAVVIIVVGRSGSSDNQASGGGGQTGGTAQSAQSEASKSSEGAKGNSGDNSSSSSGSATSTDLPKSFPVPDGVDISSYSKDGEVAGLATLSDPAAAYDFWISELPKAGYKISGKTKTGSGDGLIGQITFSGNGYGTSTISIVGTTGAIELKP